MGGAVASATVGLTPATDSLSPDQRENEHGVSQEFEESLLLWIAGAGGCRYCPGFGVEHA
jgi:hypothetical protein